MRICHALPRAVLFIAKSGSTDGGSLQATRLSRVMRATQKLVVVPLQGKKRPNESIRRYRMFLTDSI
jgi:hypothetical protein